jgi:hypothetical protein
MPCESKSLRDHLATPRELRARRFNVEDSGGLAITSGLNRGFAVDLKSTPTIVTINVFVITQSEINLWVAVCFSAITGNFFARADFHDLGGFHRIPLAD